MVEGHVNRLKFAKHAAVCQEDVVLPGIHLCQGFAICGNPLMRMSLQDSGTRVSSSQATKSGLILLYSL
jgi:hypothetical protein